MPDIPPEGTAHSPNEPKCVGHSPDGFPAGMWYQITEVLLKS